MHIALLIQTRLNEGYPYQLSGRTAYLSAIVGNRLQTLQSIAYIFFDGIINNAGE